MLEKVFIPVSQQHAYNGQLHNSLTDVETYPADLWCLHGLRYAWVRR